MELLTKINKYLNENEPNIRFSPNTRIGLRFNNIKLTIQDIHKLRKYIQDARRPNKDDGMEVLFRLGEQLLKEPSIRAVLDIDYDED